MKVTIQIPDDVYDTLGQTHQEVQAQISRRLKLLPTPIDPDDKLVVVSADQRRIIEAAVHRQIDAADDLVFVVKALASLKIGPIERALSVSEAQRLAAYADSMGLPAAQAAQELLDPIFDELWNRV